MSVYGFTERTRLDYIRARLGRAEMVTRDGYGAVNGSLVAPMNSMTALAPLGAALLRQASAGYGAVLGAIFVGSLALCAGF